MKTIKFSEDELTFLRQLYTDEIESAERYVIQIREVLKKLGGQKRATKKGRPKRVILPAPVEVATKAVINPGDMETINRPTPKKKKVFNRNFSGKRRSKRISLVPLRKPLRIKGPSVEKWEESFLGSKPETSGINTIPPTEE